MSTTNPLDFNQAGYYANHMESETFGQRLKRLRQASGLGVRELARRAGIASHASISQAEAGRGWARTPGPDVTEPLERALGVPHDVLLGRVEAGKFADPRPRFLVEPVKVLLKRLGAEQVEDIEFDMKAAAGPKRRSPQSERVRPRKPHYVIEVEGDCMVPEINNGDVVHFDPDLDPENGDWVVATVDGNNAIVKKLVVKGGIMQQLMPLNGEPLVIDENVRIVGVVISYERPGPRGRRK